MYTTIEHIQIHALDHPLSLPFSTARGMISSLQNVVVCVRLSDGSTGWGEIPVSVSGQDDSQATVLESARRGAALMLGRDAAYWKNLAAELREGLPQKVAVRYGLEMSIVDAVARSRGQSLQSFFGSNQSSLETHAILPMVSEAEAAVLARAHLAAGFSKIKVLVGQNVEQDLARVQAVMAAHPKCQLFLDAGEGYCYQQAIELLQSLSKLGVTPYAFEQPTARDDPEGMAKLTEESGIAIVADESCRNAADMARIIHSKMAHGVNIKLSKCGLTEAMEMVALAVHRRLPLMIESALATRLGNGFAAHFAAGTGCFEWVFLAAPSQLKSDPVQGGVHQKGNKLLFSEGALGHGGSLDLPSS